MNDEYNDDFGALKFDEVVDSIVARDAVLMRAGAVHSLLVFRGGLCPSGWSSSRGTCGTAQSCTCGRRAQMG